MLAGMTAASAPLPGRVVGELHEVATLAHDADRRVLLSRLARVDAPYGSWLRREELGLLSLPSGQVLACDPTYESFEGEVFTRRVRPGRYPVVVTRLGEAQASPHDRVAAAAIVLRDELPARWELALCDGQKLADLGPEQIFGYGVDGGTGCFVDVEHADEFAAGKRNFSRLLRAFERGDYAPLVFPLRDEPAVAVFQSGHGDGFYASYWGLDARGEPVCLVTDFGVLTAAVGATLRFGEDGGLRPGRLEHPALARLGLAIEVREVGPDAVAATMTGATHRVDDLRLLVPDGDDWRHLPCATQTTVSETETTRRLLPDGAPPRVALELAVTVGLAMMRAEEEPVAKSPVVRRRRAP